MLIDTIAYVGRLAASLITCVEYLILILLPTTEQSLFAFSYTTLTLARRQTIRGVVTISANPY